MIDYSLILTQIEQSLKSLPEYNNLQDFSTEFYQFWQTLGQLVQQSLIQSQIEQREAKYKYAKKKKKVRVSYRIDSANKLLQWYFNYLD
jgi:hypothetical protein